jgi:hypothetical protein
MILLQSLLLPLLILNNLEAQDFSFCFFSNKRGRLQADMLVAQAKHAHRGAMKATHHYDSLQNCLSILVSPEGLKAAQDSYERFMKTSPSPGKEILPEKNILVFFGSEKIFKIPGGEKLHDGQGNTIRISARLVHESIVEYKIQRQKKILTLFRGIGEEETVDMDQVLLYWNEKEIFNKLYKHGMNKALEGRSLRASHLPK